MPNLSQFTRKDQMNKLVAGDKINASGGVLLGAGRTLEPDTTNRTIFIGLGGNGVKTINHIKNVVSKRLSGEWRRYIAFLGIDTDRTEFDKAKYLNATEYVVTTWPGVNDRYSDRRFYPNAALRFMPEDANKPNRTLKMPDLNQPGANQKRLVGRAKLHDHPAGQEAVDVQIVTALESLVSNGVLAELDDQGAFEVYVIGSTCGGTCSGAFLDMPSLIRQALFNIAGSNDRLNIHAILYLPDALPGKLPTNVRNNLQANGYASLKELNYYQGMEMREGYRETWSYNGTGNPDLTMTASDKFYSIPYLVGSPGGSSDEAPAQCREVIGEFLVSLLAKITTTGTQDVFLTQSFLSNALDRSHWEARPTDNLEPNKEQASTYHDFPMSFSAIGFAKAKAPEDIVRAYQVNKIASDAGIRPISKDERQKLVNTAKPGTLVPFRAMEDFMNSTEATAAINRILKPLDDMLDVIYKSSFNAEADLAGIDLTFEGLKNPATRPAMDQRMKIVVEQRTNGDELRALETKIKEKYADFRTRVQEFVEQEGPFAYVQLFDGSYTCKEGETAVGIGAKLEYLISGKNLNGSDRAYLTEENTATALNSAATELSKMGNSLKDKIVTTIFKDKQNAARSTYLAAYNNWTNAQIITPKRKAALGADGYLARIFYAGALDLRNDLKSFGEVLEVLGGVYADHGKKMDNFNAFQEADVGEATVNMAAINEASYNWLKKKADDAAQANQGEQFRKKLIKHFFDGANSQKWLDVPESIAKQDNTGTVEMAFDDAVIPARELFDQIAADVIAAPVEVTVLDLFRTLKKDKGMSFEDIAKMLLKDLAIRSKPRYKGGPGSATHKYIMYPNVLGSGVEDGPEIAQALRSVAGTGVSVYTSDDADGIMYYQQVTGLEVYKLNELEAWERAYENKLSQGGNLLHGTSPDTTRVVEGNRSYFMETLPWADYPAITGNENPESPDPVTGQISREGQFRIKLRETMKEALKLGVLYKEQDANKLWHIYRVHCDRTIPQWRFSMSACPSDELGLKPLGKKLAECVAQQNGKSLEMADGARCISKPVTLTYAGQLSKLYDDEELAWEYAVRCLRANVPMYVEVLQTMAKFREWAKDILRYNEGILAKMRPAKMVWLMRGGVLYRNSNNIWMLKNENGGSEVIMDMSEDMMMFDWNLQNVKSNGLVGYYLFQQIDSRLPGDSLDAACRFAAEEMKVLQQNRDMEALKAGMALFDELMAESAQLAEKGARPNADGKTPPLAKFTSWMEMSLGYDQNQAKEVELFYSRVPLARSLQPRHFQ